MKIVVLDGHALNPGDLSWEDLQSLGECTVYERTAAEETVNRSVDAEIVITNKTVMGGTIIGQLPRLKYIGVLATGYNVVDVEAAGQRGIPVTNVPEYSTGSVAQMVFAHVLHFYNHVAEHSMSVSKGAWSRSKDFCFWEYPLVDLQGKTMGIVGLGKIGSAVARLAGAFGMDVLAYGPRKPRNVPDGVELVDLESLLDASDVVSLHCPLTDDNKGLVDAEFLGRMKRSAFLINTSRGPLVDEHALAHALNRGDIAGAGLDVLSEEPPAPDCPLVTAINCFITPHIAWATLGARQRLMRTAVENVRAFLRGEAVNVVNEIKL